MDYSVSTYVSLCLLALFGAYIVYQLLLSPLAGVPGPLPAKLSRFWLIKLSFTGGAHRVIPALHHQYGPLVRIAPNEVSVADVPAVKQIYKPATKFRKSDWYSVWQGRRKFDLFPERDEKIHAAQRSLVSYPYSMEYLKTLEKFVDDAMNLFFRHMENLRGQGVINLGKWVQLLAFDVIGEITFSRRFGFMDAGDDSGAFGQIERALRSAAWVGQVPWLYWLHDFLSPVIGNHLAINARHGSLRSFAVKEVNARDERGSDHEDILSRLFAVHEAKPQEFDLNSVQSMATSNIFAGSDTTATSIRAVVYYLLKNPETKQKLVREIDEHQSKGRLSDPVTLNQAYDMPYLQAVLWEALRMHPAVGMSLPRVVPAEGFEVEGHFLPAGTVIGANPWAIHRIESVFGSNVNEFDPERWIKGDAAEMRRCFFAFGGGSRVCIGQNVGWMEMSKLIPTLFMKYNVTLADPNAEWTMSSWWFVMQRGVHVKLHPR